MDNVESIRILNEARSLELGAINVYMRIHYSLRDSNYETLADRVKAVAISEMKHAEGLGERIAELDGVPTLDRKIPDYAEQLASDPLELYATLSSMEQETVDAYNRFIRELAQGEDEVSARLLKSYIAEENDHLTYFADLTTAIGRFGDAFLAQHVTV